MCAAINVVTPSAYSGLVPLAIRIFLFRFFLWIVALGCAVSGAASGRFSFRLVLDAAIACAFVPVMSVGACALVLTWRRRRQGPGLLDATGAFLDGNAPWLIWLTMAAAFVSIVPPRAIGPWILPIEISAAVPLACCLAIDFRFFRETVDRTAGQAWGDLATQRLLSWSGIITYFLGIAIWGEVVPQIIGWAGW